MHLFKAIVCSDAYKFIYHFLKIRGHKKAAKSVKKSAKDVVDLDKEEVQEKTTLLDIIAEWRKQSLIDHGCVVEQQVYFFPAVIIVSRLGLCLKVCDTSHHQPRRSR